MTNDYPPEPAVDDLADLAGDGVADNATLGQQVYQDLEDRILCGQMVPGQRVSLRGLAASLGTSMQPVREAVGRLVAAQALEVAPNRTLRVRPVDRALADEIWSMRLLLEGEAVARFAARRAPDEARALTQHNETLRSFRFGIDLEPTMRELMAWNRALAEGSRAPLLIEAIARMRLRYAPWLAAALGVQRPFDENFLQFTLHMQDELVLAIAAGDTAAARYIRCADLRSFQRYLYTRLNWD